MKNEMSAFDILAISTEMQSIMGGYVDKVFHWDGKNVLLRANTSSHGKKEIMLQDMRWFYLAPERPEMPDIPSQFAVNLRKYLTNCRIISIKQWEFDRIIVMELEKGISRYQLIIELFGNGNLILVSEGKILNAVLSRKWRHREVRPGLEYSFPPPRFNPNSMDEETFRKAVLTSSSDTVRTLATLINIGGQYAEETCLRAGVDKDHKAKELNEDSIHRLYESLIILLREARGNLHPREILEEGKAVDVTPISLIQYATKEVHEYPTFSDAIYSYVSHLEVPEGSKEDPEALRLQRQLEQQQSVIDAQMAEIREYTEQAEAIYSDYMAVDALLKKLDYITKDLNWEQTTERVSKLPPIIAVDPKKHKVTATIADRKVSLDYTLGVEGNANALYQQAKEAKDKMQGAQAALKETNSRLAKKLKEGEARRLAVKRVARKTKEFWFERYKWFMTSGDRLVLGGRDAHSNDQLVKKHLKATERFIHADVHGAPSIVMINGAEASEEEMREACTFALTHSKAWMAGATEGTAYWVLPDQVSKMAQAGEFVPRGAFIIRGKRNYIYHLPLELAIGEIDYGGERKVMCGPLSSLEARSNRYAMIGPGKLDHGRVSSQLSKLFEVPEEEISRILPPGNIEIREIKGFILEDKKIS